MTTERIDFGAACPRWCDDHSQCTGSHCHAEHPTFEEGAERMSVGLVQVGDLPVCVTIDAPYAYCSIAEAVELRDTLDALIRLAGDQ